MSSNRFIGRRLSVTTVQTSPVSPFVDVVTPYDASGGSLSVVLPALSSLVEGDLVVARKVDASANTVTVSVSPGDLFVDGLADSSVLSREGHQIVLRVRLLSGRLYWVNDTGSDTGDEGGSVPASASTGAPLAARYRGLQGVTDAVSSSVASGSDVDGVSTPVVWDSGAGRWRFAGVVPVPLDGNAGYGINDNNTFGQSFVTQPVVVEFWSNATDLRAYFYSSGKADMWAVVDDQRITSGFVHADVGEGDATWKLTQSDPVWRKWRLCVSNPLHALAVNDGAVMVPTTPGFQVAVVGDSYVQGSVNTANAVSAGVSGNVTAGSVFGEFEQLTGLDVWRCGVTATGYVAQGEVGADGPYGSARRLAGLAGLPGMDAVVVFGSLNDWQSPSAAAEAAEGTWDAVKAAQPGAALIVVGVQSLGAPNSALDELNDALRVAATASAAVDAFVDVRARGFMTGTGRDGGPEGDGNCDVFLSADGVHPTHLGYRWWAENLARLLGAVVL